MKVVMYSKSTCPYCTMAKRLLQAKEVEWEEIDIQADPTKRDEMIQRSGQTTVPQIFVGDLHVGGFDDLSALEDAGKLDAVLEAVGDKVKEEGE